MHQMIAAPTARRSWLSRFWRLINADRFNARCELKDRSDLSDASTAGRAMQARSVPLSEVRAAIRLGCHDQAQTMLRSNVFPERRAECLNLLGVTYEMQHQWKLARRYYGKAIWLDRNYEPAQQNMRRLYELNTFGTSRITTALGDEKPALAKLLAHVDARR